MSEAPLWSPNSERAAATNMTAFRHEVERRTGRVLPDYAALYDWSIQDSEGFWSTLWDHAGVVASARGATVLVIGQDWDNDVRVVLFVHLRDGATLDAALVDRIKRQIRDNTTPRHVPAKIVAITDIPRTRSGKIVELAVRNIVHGQPVKNVEVLDNPGALEQFRNRPELQT
jgi:acyl-coenzyme A synthetase/AMP-(fatty) acid ligase